MAMSIDRRSVLGATAFAAAAPLFEQAIRQREAAAASTAEANFWAAVTYFNARLWDPQLKSWLDPNVTMHLIRNSGGPYNNRDAVINYLKSKTFPNEIEQF